MSAIGACGIVALAFALMVAWLHLVAAIVTVVQVRPWQSVTTDPLYVGMATALGLGGALWVGKAWYDPNAPWRKLLALRAASPGVLALSVLFGIAFQIPLSELQNFSESLFPIDPAQKEAFYRLLAPSGWRQVLSTTAALVAIAPIFEEFLFRGLILQALRKSRGTAQALAVSSVLFGLCHVRILAALFPACAAGLIFGAIALRTRSTLPAIVSHAAINAAPLLLSERLLAVPGFNVAGKLEEHVALPFLLATLAIAAVALIAMMYLGGHRPATDETNRPAT
jgi:membrane protease YdiL (CAAX protease family)